MNNHRNASIHPVVRVAHRNHSRGWPLIPAVAGLAPFCAGGRPARRDHGHRCRNRGEPDMSEGTTQGEIFIVDDDPAVRDALSVVFSLEGYQVTELRRGRVVPGRGAVAHFRPASCSTSTCRAAPVSISSRSSTPSITGADLHHFRTGRHPDGGRGHQERRARFHREAVRRQHGGRPRPRGDRGVDAPTRGRQRSRMSWRRSSLGATC